MGNHPPASSRTGPLIQIENLTKIYGTGDQQVHALRGINLQFQSKDSVALMGSSGSGKSTLMNILGCLDRATDGTYKLEGIEVGSLSRNELANLRNQKIGFVFQSFHLLPRTSALENVEMPMLYHPQPCSSREMRDRAIAALERVGLANRAHHHPNAMSGGQQQRVAIARALVNHPQILLADEPTGNLDTKTSLEIMALFKELNAEGLTVIIVTHEPDISLHMQRTIHLQDGLIIRDELNPDDAS